MSLLDLQTQFTSAAVPPAPSGTPTADQIPVAPGDTMIKATGMYNATNVIDMWNGQAAPPIPPLGGPEIVDLGRGRPVELLIEIIASCAGTGATVQFQLVTADSYMSGALSGNVTVQQQTAPIPVAQLLQGYMPDIPALNVGLNRVPTNRYLGIQWVLAGAALTSGAFSAGLVIDDISNIASL